MSNLRGQIIRISNLIAPSRAEWQKALDMVLELEAEVEALRNERAQAGKRAMLAEDINEELKSELADCQTRVNAAKTILIEAGFPAASKFINN